MRFDSTPVKCISGLKIVVRLEFLCILFQLFCYAPLRPFVSSFLVLTRVTSESRVVSWRHMVIRPLVSCAVAVVPRRDASPITDHKHVMHAPLASTIETRVWQVHTVVLGAIHWHGWCHETGVARCIVSFPNVDGLFWSCALHPLQLKFAAASLTCHVTLWHSSLVPPRNAFLALCFATRRVLTVLASCATRYHFQLYIPRIMCLGLFTDRLRQLHLSILDSFMPLTKV
mmetsp:Transcript_67461/g.130366  ORF Transcript_67461/g.130366 Transcript_67461/m.130366 type:complete len:229 (+) Transcript_67461:751-1437(+)